MVMKNLQILSYHVRHEDTIFIPEMKRRGRINVIDKRKLYWFVWQIPL